MADLEDMTAKPTRDSGRTPLVTRLLSGLWSQEGSLGQKALRGAFWTIGGEWTANALTVVQTVILVRLLVPADFGIMRIAGFLLAAMAVFTRTGMGAAIIQRKDLDKQTINTAWTINLLRSLALYAAVWLVAPWGARFYEDPLICPILRVLGLNLVLNGFENIGLTLLTKDLNFRTRQLFYTVTLAVSVLITVVGGFILRSVWAIVIGQVALSAMRVVGSYMIHPYRPRPDFVWQKAASLINFGKWMLASGIVIFLKTQLDDAIVGKMLGLEALGFYALAYGLSNMPATAITHAISGVSFPAYSKLQDDRERLGQAWLKVLCINGAVSIPAAAGMFVLAPEIVNVVYGPPYASMVPAFMVLCLFGLLRSLAGTTGPVFMAVGKPYIVSILVTMNLVIMLSLIYPLTKAHGIVGAAWATVVPNCVLFPVSFVIVARLTRADIRSVVHAVAGPVVSATTMVVALRFLKMAARIFNPFLLLVFVAGGALIYFVVLFATSREAIRAASDVLRKVAEGASSARGAGG